MNKYYALSQEGKNASITIYGDITSWPWLESDVSAYLLSKQIEGLEADTINVYINSYGGEVAEGLAIYNALKRHNAKVVTHCDGFACSAASVVFMAGDSRLMGEASLLMIHNAWATTSGNAAELRKAANDLDTISAAAANAYKAAVNISELELGLLLDNETWISPQDAVTMGFATEIEKYPASEAPAASARLTVLAKLQNKSIPQFCLDAESIVEQLFQRIKLETAKEQTQSEKPQTFLSAIMRGRKTKE